MPMENMQLLEFMDRFPVREYRIRDEKIEARILSGGPEQMSNTAVTRWLEQSLGWRRLLRACVGLEPTKFVQDSWGREIALTHREFDESP